MSKIQSRKEAGAVSVGVRQKHHSFKYYKPAEKDLRREGKTLDINVRSEFGSNSIRLNGTQIRTLKKILQAAGELPTSINV